MLNLRRYSDHLRAKSVQRLAPLMLDLSTWTARRKLARSKAQPFRILIDNAVIGNGVTHGTAWISTGTQKWGPLDVPTGYAARTPVHSPDDASDRYKNVKYLPGIASLAKRGYIQLFTSSELWTEQICQPVGRYSGYGHFAYSLFRDIEIPSIDQIHFPDIGGMGTPSVDDQQSQRLKSNSDPVYRKLVGQLGVTALNHLKVLLEHL